MYYYEIVNNHKLDTPMSNMKFINEYIFILFMSINVVRTKAMTKGNLYFNEIIRRYDLKIKLLQKVLSYKINIIK